MSESERKVWSITITGDDAITIRMPSSPVLHHKGGHTLGQVMCTWYELLFLLAGVRAQGLAAEVLNPPQEELPAELPAEEPASDPP